MKTSATAGGACATAPGDLPDELTGGHAEARVRVDGAERQLLESELKLRNCALDAAASHFMIVDMQCPGWPLVFVNRALARDHGYEPHELLGKSPAELVPEELNPQRLELVNDAMRAGTPLRIELRARRRDGSSFWAGISLAPIRDAIGRVTHYVSIGADITARLEEAENQRRLQRQLHAELKERERMAIELRFAQKRESVGRLAAGIAHEINTPIQYVGDSVRFLQGAMADIESLLSLYRTTFANLGADLVPPQLAARIRAAESAADLNFLVEEAPKSFARTFDGVARVAAIVQAMKEFADSDANQQTLADINHAIETTLMVARNEYKYFATIEAHLSTLPEVVCNVGELNQVFLNLIINAAQAIEQAGRDAGSGRINVSTAVAGSSVAIVIADNGCGIPAENLDNIFDPFFTTKEVGQGTGQGLAIARSIVVDRHGGSIDAASTVGAGTRFVLKLPIAGRGAVTSP